VAGLSDRGASHGLRAPGEGGDASSGGRRRRVGKTKTC